MRDNTGQPRGTMINKVRKLGGGGFVTHLTISADGLTKVCGCDVFQCYVFKSTGTAWEPLMTIASLPVGEATISNSSSITDAGCYASAVAPNDKTVIYATYNAYWYVSSNTGATFTRSALAAKDTRSNSGAQRLWGYKLAVDPQNASVAMLGTMGAGIYVTTDKLATTPTAVTGITAGATYGGVATPHLVACDPASTVTGGQKQIWYISKFGTGVYQSTTGPLGTYSLLASSPLNPVAMVCDPNGNLWVLDTTATQNIWKWNGTTWAQNTTCKALQFSAIAVEPGNANNIAVTTVDGFFQRSTDGGTTWIGSDTWYDTYPAPVGREILANQIPWLQTVPGLGFPSTICFDASQTNKLYCAHGLGVIYSTPPATFTRWTWTDLTQGIEELVGTYALNPPGGNTTVPIFGTMDKMMWVDSNLDVYSPGPVGPTGSGLSHTWCMDYAIGDPNFVVSLTVYTNNRMAYSTDRGLTWTKFNNQHPDGTLIGGYCAVGAKGVGGGVNVIWVPSNNGKAVYRKSTDPITDPWRYLAFPGYATGFGNWCNAFYVRRYTLCADKANPGTFYIVINSVNQPSGSLDTAMRGLWKTTDEGDNWTRIYTNVLDSEGGSGDFWHGILKCMPNQPGKMYYTPGRDYASGRLKYSSDYGVTWNPVANVFGCRCFDFGKAATGSSYPTIFVEATISGVYGVYMSIDNCATWITLSTQNPAGNGDIINGLFGDMNTFGRAYLAYSGSGFSYIDFTQKMRLAP